MYIYIYYDKHDTIITTTITTTNNNHIDINISISNCSTNRPLRQRALAVRLGEGKRHKYHKHNIRRA